MSAKRSTKRTSQAKIKTHSRKMIRNIRKSIKGLKSRLPFVKKRKTTKAKDNSARLKTYANLSSRQALSKREQRRRKRAKYLATLPKSRLKRIAYRLNPKRALRFWFSRDGAILALKISGIGLVVVFVTLFALFAYFRKDLPNPNDAEKRVISKTTRFYDRTGKVLLYSTYSDENRVVVDFDQMSDYIKWATVAIEDKDFYNHGGFSMSGIMRAAFNNILKRDATGQGGSTITQQFIKNALVGSESTYTRKLKELILSVELERLYTKDEILKFYLNEIPYGGQLYGIEAASRSFFDKTSAELTIDEAALLAALPQSPTTYSPYGENTDLLIGRQHYIIDLMAEQGYITQDEADQAKAVDTLKKVVPIADQSLYRDIKAPHFVLEIERQLEEQYGSDFVQSGGLKIITTLDWKAQQLAEKAMKDNFQYVMHPQDGIGSGGDNAAISVSDVETGQVLAQVGSRDFFYPGYGAFNAATAGRQPGSSFKPFGYAQLFYNDRWSPGSIIWDNKITFPGWAPNDFDFKWPGPMKVRDALGRSRNIPAIKALYIAGVDDTIALARAMGDKSLCDDCNYGLSLVLGAGEVKLAEHVHAYSTFARGGIYKPQTYILKIENAEGEIIDEWHDTEGEQVLDPQNAYLITNIISDDDARAGTFRHNNPRLVVPGLVHTVKTGTTDESRDGWMMGYTTCTAVGVWVGNHDNKPMDTVTSWQTGPMWTQVMREVNKERNCGTDQFKRPEGIKTVKIDPVTGRNATSKTKNPIIDIAASWFKGVPAESEQKYTIDKISGKLATECTPERAKEEVSDTGIAPELPPDDPLFAAWAKTAGYSATPGITEKDDVHSCSDTLPNVSVSVSDISPGMYLFTANYSEGTHPLQTLNFKVDGQIVLSTNVSGSGNETYTYISDKSGTVTVSAEVIDTVLYDNSSVPVDYTVVPYDNSIAFYSPVEGSTVPVPPSGLTVYWDKVNDANDGYQICHSLNSVDQGCVFETHKNHAYYTFSAATSSSYTFTVLALRDGMTIASGTLSFSTSP